MSRDRLEPDDSVVY